MANIIITHFSGIFHNDRFQSSAFYDGLVEAFCSQGHNVLHILTSDFLPTPWNGNNRPISQSIKNKVLGKIKNFNPDLVISFNNSSIEGIENTVDCPIALWDADRFEFFNDKKFILKNQDRYCYLAFSETGVQDYHHILTTKHASISRVSSATACKSLNKEKIYNISFIGNPFFNSFNLLKFLEENPTYRELSFEDIDKLENFSETFGRKYHIRKSEFKYRQSGFDRAAITCSLLDYGLKVFGPRNWLDLAFLSEKIFGTYDNRVVYSLKHNELIYNRSHISLNISHAQNITGYPWRVLDIMGTSSVLLSNYSSDLVQDFPNINLPLYHSRAEAVDLAKKLLGDPVWREDLSLQCNQAVEEDFRWHHRFPLIAELTGVDLNSKKQKGNYELLHIDTPVINKCIKLLLFLRGEQRNKSVKRKLLFNYRKAIQKIFPSVAYAAQRYYLQRNKKNIDEYE